MPHPTPSPANDPSTAAEVMKQLITIGAVTVGAVLSLALQKLSSPFERWTALLSIGLGAVSVFLALLFLTDIAAKALGTQPKSVTYRRRLFLVSWSFFLASVICASLYAASRADLI